VAQRPADLRPARLPGGTAQQLGARVGPALARRDVEVAPAQRRTDLLQDAGGVGRAVDPVGHADDAVAPRRRHDRERSFDHVRGVWPVQGAEDVQRLPQGDARRRPVEGERAERRWQEAADGRVRVHQLALVVVVGRARQCAHRGHGQVDLAVAVLIGDGVAQVGVAIAGIADDERHVAQEQRRRVQVTQRAQPFPLADPRRAVDQVIDQCVQHVDDIVVRGDLQHAGRGQQRGHAPVVRHAANGLRPRRQGVARQRPHAAGGDTGQVQAAHANGADLLQAAHRRDERNGTHRGGAAAQAI